MPDVPELQFEVPPAIALRMVRAQRELPADMGVLLAGKPGTGGTTQVVRQTSGALSALRVVWEDELGVVRPLDASDAGHIDLVCGLTLTGASGPADVTVQRSGPVDDAAWAWTPGRVWLGAGGALTQVVPAAGFDLVVGFAVSPTRLYLDFQDHVELE